MTSRKKAEIVVTPPPFWWWIHKQFPEALLDKQIFAFGNKIHWAHQFDGQALSLDLIAHETTHLKQQGFSNFGAIKWWRRYAKDPQFRLEQEIEAMRAQMAMARTMTNNRQVLFELEMKQAGNLASPVYNNMVSVSEAYDLITK